MRVWDGPGWYPIEGTVHWADGTRERRRRDVWLPSKDFYDELSSTIAEEGLRMTAKREPEYYTDKAGEWRWRVRDENGEIIDAASEGFSSRAKAEYNYGQN